MSKGAISGLAAAVLLLGCALFAKADDTTRRAQEELRKRNLYFGDVDGQLNQGIVGALRRYQERKGFPITGALDETTLRSLSIPVDEKGHSGPWPDITILRSDKARPAGQDAPLADAGGSGDKEVTPSPAPPAFTAHAPEAAAIQAPFSREQASHFIEAYLRADETNVPAEEMAFYGDRVDYFDYGTVDRAFILRDIRYYYRRWPKRNFSLIGPVSVLPASHPDETGVRFQLHYSYTGVQEGRQINVAGDTENVFTLRSGASGEQRIVGMKEQRIRKP